jgi:Fe(3+) dicitrate transport protein
MNHLHFGRTVLSAAILAALGPALAQDDTSDTSRPIDTVTIIGHRIDVSDVPGSAHVIDAEELQIFMQSDVMRVLRTVPGVYLQEEEGFGLRPNIGIRGSGLDRSARIALLEDGILMAPAPYAAASAYYFPTQRRMNSLEVLKGPASIAVGPRTTGGALNMISTPVPQNGFHTSLDVRAGDHGTADAHINAGHGGERVSWLLETVQAQSDGFKFIDGPVGGDTGFDIEDYVGKLQIDSDPSSTVYQSLRFKVGFTDQVSDETYLGLTDDDFAAEPNMRYAASANDVFESEHEQYAVSYVIDSGNAWRGEITAYRNDFARNWYKLQSVGGESIGNVLEDPQTFATELGYLKGTTSPDDAIQIRANNREYYSQGVQGSLGWDFGVGETEIGLTAGFRIHEDEEDRHQWQDGYRMQDGTLVLTSAGVPGTQTNRVSSAEAQSMFLTGEIRTGGWILTPGVRYEDVDMTRLDYSTSDPDRVNGPSRVRENSVSVWIPGIGALYSVTDEWRLLAGVHKGYSPPSPGSSADEETSINFEAGTRYDRNGFSFEGIYFHNDYDNLVGTVTESTGGGGEIGDQFDGGEVVVQGFELSGGYGWSLGAIEVPVMLRYTWTTEAEFKTGFESEFDPWGDVQPGDELPYIPEHQLRATAGLRADRWSVDLAASFMGERRTTAGQGAFEPAESIDSHTVWDLVANWNFTSQLSTYVKVDNLFDETYMAARRPAGVRPGLPRTAYIGFTYRL